MNFIADAISSVANYAGSFLPGASTTTQSQPFAAQRLTLVDVTATHDIVAQATGFPTEIVLLILDYAEYWIHEHHARTAQLRAAASLGNGTHECASLYTQTPPLCFGIEGAPALLKPRRVRFDIVSRDQGWSDNAQDQGTYRGAFSWFEASILHEDAAFEGETRREPLKGLSLSGIANYMPAYAYATQTPMFLVGSRPDLMMRIIRRNGYEARARDGNEITWLLQRNQVASASFVTHVVEWNLDQGRNVVEEEWPEHGAGNGHGFVAALQRGDRIGIWARALYPGWQNLVQSAKVTVYYAL